MTTMRITAPSLPSCRVRRVTEYIEQNLDKERRLAGLPALVYSAFLATPEISIALISRLVGFWTPSHFITVFRRVRGVTPRDTERSLREERPRGDGG